MSESAFGSGSRAASGPAESGPGLPDEPQPSIGPETLLSLLDDDCARDILRMTRQEFRATVSEVLLTFEDGDITVGDAR